jgi:hypothetical protein
MCLRRLFIVLFVSVSSISAYAQDAKKTADDFATKWVTAYDAGDAAALAAFFTPDGVFNAPSGAVLKGRDAIEKALTGRIKAGWTSRRPTRGWQAAPFGPPVNMVWSVPENRPANRAADTLAGCLFVRAMSGARRCSPRM